MRTEIKATNLELTSALSEFVQKKMDMLDKFMSIPGSPENPLAFVQVEKVAGAHHKKGELFRCEIQFDLGSALLRVEKITPDMYKSIEKVKDELERQLVRRKERALSLKKKGADADE